MGDDHSIRGENKDLPLYEQEVTNVDHEQEDRLLEMKGGEQACLYMDDYLPTREGYPVPQQGDRLNQSDSRIETPSSTNLQPVHALNENSNRASNPNSNPSVHSVLQSRGSTPFPFSTRRTTTTTATLLSSETILPSSLLRARRRELDGGIRLASGNDEDELDTLPPAYARY